ncbi:MAG: hypothetical protein WCV50_06435 [Patescibacteria group bacterium]|jgi:hypothetical protein
MGKQHFIQKGDGSEVSITQEGEIAGFRAGDRVRYTDECFPHLSGKTALVVGFDEQNQIWTQPDGQTGCASTREDHATKHLIKL